MNKILLIDETTFGKDEYSSFEGYVIHTQQAKYRVGIGNYQSCCENWGILTTFEDPQEFIGANLLQVDIVDEALNKKTIVEDMYEGGVVFVNFETDKGTFQIAAYNSHNGYYGHTVLVQKIVDDKTDVILKTAI